MKNGFKQKILDRSTVGGRRHLFVIVFAEYGSTREKIPILSLTLSSVLETQVKD